MTRYSAEFKAKVALEAIRGERTGSLAQSNNHPRVGVERFVSDQDIRVHVGEQMISANQIMSLSAGQEEPHGVDQGIDHGMDLVAQPGMVSCQKGC